MDICDRALEHKKDLYSEVVSNSDRQVISEIVKKKKNKAVCIILLHTWLLTYTLTISNYFTTNYSKCMVISQLNTCHCPLTLLWALTLRLQLSLTHKELFLPQVST